MKNLKNRIANVLIAELETKTLDQITINDIVSQLNVSRQAFYYHFMDIYNVVEYIFKRATSEILDTNSDISSWSNGFFSIMTWLRNKRNVVINAFRSVPRDYVETFMQNVTSVYIKIVVDKETEGLSITQDQRKFITKFYTLSFNALVIDWIKKGMKEDPKTLIYNVETLLYGDIKKAGLNFQHYNLLNK